MAETGGARPGVVGVDVLGRRKYTVEFKRRLARMALEPGASVAGIALAHQLNANQLFKWRRWYLRQRGETALEPKLEPPPEPAATLLPVVVAPVGRPILEPAVTAPAITERDAEPPAQPGQIEIALGRARVRVSGAVDPALVKLVLNHLHRR